jgi:hypothetical protein
LPEAFDRDKPRLRVQAVRVYVLAVIAVKADKDRVEITIPTEGLTPEQVNDFVSWLRVESIVQRSKLTEEAAWQLSEDIKADWWAKNKHRFIPREDE